MKQANQFSVALGSGAPGVLQKPIRFDAGRKCTRIRLRCSPQLTSTDAAAYNMTPADCATLAAAIAGNLSLQFGDTEPEVVDPNTPFPLLRLLQGVLEEQDFKISNIPLSSVAAGQVAVPAGGSLTPIVEIVRSFSFERLGSRMHDTCPGASQMKQLQLALTPGAIPTFDGGKVSVANATNVPVLVIFDDIPADGDDWATVPKLRETTTAGINIPLPTGAGGSILAVMDQGYAAAASPLTLFTIDADGRRMQGIATAAQVLSSYFEDLPLGSFDWSSLATPLYVAPAFDELASLDSADELVFSQPNDDLTAPKLCVVYVEKNTKSSVSRVGTNLLGSEHGPKKFRLATRFGAEGKRVPEHVGAIAPLSVLREGHPGYDLAPGTIFARGAPPVDDVPSYLAASAQSAAANHPGGLDSSAGTASLAHAVKWLTAAMPGYASSNRGGGIGTIFHMQMAQKILGHGVENQGQLKVANVTAQALVQRIASIF